MPRMLVAANAIPSRPLQRRFSAVALALAAAPCAVQRCTAAPLVGFDRAEFSYSLVRQGGIEATYLLPRLLDTRPFVLSDATPYLLACDDLCEEGELYPPQAFNPACRREANVVQLDLAALQRPAFIRDHLFPRRLLPLEQALAGQPGEEELRKWPVDHRPFKAPDFFDGFSVLARLAMRPAEAAALEAREGALAASAMHVALLTAHVLVEAACFSWDLPRSLGSLHQLLLDESGVAPHLLGPERLPWAELLAQRWGFAVFGALGELARLLESVPRGAPEWGDPGEARPPGAPTRCSAERALERLDSAVVTGGNSQRLALRAVAAAERATAGCESPSSLGDFVLGAWGRLWRRLAALAEHLPAASVAPAAGPRSEQSRTRPLSRGARRPQLLGLCGGRPWQARGLAGGAAIVTVMALSLLQPPAPFADEGVNGSLAGGRQPARPAPLRLEVLLFAHTEDDCLFFVSHNHCQALPQLLMAAWRCALSEAPGGQPFFEAAGSAFSGRMEEVVLSCELPEDLELPGTFYLSLRPEKQEQAAWSVEGVPVCSRPRPETPPRRLTLCSTVRWGMRGKAESALVEQWLAHHAHIGVDHVFLYDLDGSLRRLVQRQAASFASYLDLSEFFGPKFLQAVLGRFACPPQQPDCPRVPDRFDDPLDTLALMHCSFESRGRSSWVANVHSFDAYLSLGPRGPRGTGRDSSGSRTPDTRSWCSY